MTRKITKKDIGKLCEFWNEGGDKYISLLGAIVHIWGGERRNYPYASHGNWMWWEKCRRLTKEEVEKYL